jgi:AraC-like DNA-binding protein
MRPSQIRRQSRKASARSVLYASEDISVAPLLAIPPLLRELGVDPATVFKRVGIDPRALSDTANRLPFGLAGRLLEECAAESACPHFGLLVGIRSGPAAAGIAGSLIGHAGSVHAALRLFIAHLHLHDRGGVAALNPRDDGAMELSYLIHHPDTPGAAQILDASLAVACSLMRRLCGPRWTPAQVTLSRKRPQVPGPYRAYFRAPIRFDAPHSALVFPPHYLDQAVVGADPAAGKQLLQLATELDGAWPATLTELTVRALSRMVIVVAPSSSRVAEALGIKPRRLRERLEAEGSSVKELLADLRCELARQLLENSRMPIGEVAATLHYSRPGAFSRAFKGWTGKTPRQWRKTAAHSARVSLTQSPRCSIVHPSTLRMRQRVEP